MHAFNVSEYSLLACIYPCMHKCPRTHTHTHRHMTPPLQQRLLELTLRLPPSSLNAKDCVSLAHALSRCRLSAPPRLLQHICEASRRAGAAEEGGGWSFDLASMMIAALARLGYWNTPMFRLLVNVLDAEGGDCGGNHMDTLSLLSAAAAFRGGGQRGDGGEDLLEIFDRIEDMIRAMLLRCVESGMQQETQIAGPVTSGSEREGRPGLGLVLGFIAYAQKAGMLAAFMVGPGLEDDVDPEGGARLGESPGETMRAESAAEQDVRKCLVEALQVALETWLEGALREGGSRSNGLLGGVGVVGSVAIDGSVEVLPEFGQGGRALAFGMTGGRGHGEAASLAEVFNALECLGPCEGTRTMWQRVIQVRSRCCIACFSDALALCRVPQREEGERGECACRCELPARERVRRRQRGTRGSVPVFGCAQFLYLNMCQEHATVLQPV